MLTEIRDRASSGWFAWIIALLIIIPMAFWGVQEYANTDAAPSLVSIGDSKITQNEFQARLDQEQQYMRQVMGAQANNTLLNSDSFKQNVLRKMMNRALLEQVADDANYQIGDAQLVELIKDSDLFKTDGEFDQESYDRYVVQSQFSKTQFENRLRDQNKLNQVTTGYQESALVLPDEVRTVLELQAQQRTFDLVTVKQSEQLESVSVTEEEVEQYYQINQSQFMKPEQASVSYVRVATNDLLSEVEVVEDELFALYEDSKESFTTGERRDTRHILLKTSADLSADEIESQRQKALVLIDELKQGKEFSELAKTHSQDPGSAQKGGELGEVSRGQMVAEFEEAMFGLTENEISEPIKSQFGFHIIQVQKIEPSVQKSFEEVRFELEQGERQRIAEEMLLEKVEQMRDLAYEQPDSLEAVAEALSMTTQETPLFERTKGTGIAASQELRDIAFSEEVLVDGNNSEPIELSDGEFVVIRKAQHKLSEPKPLNDVAEQVKTLLKSDKASDITKQKGDALLGKSKKDWSVLAGDEALDLKTLTASLVDSDKKVNKQILDEVNKLHLVDGQPTVSFVIDKAGDYHVIRLTNIEQGDLTKVSEQVKDSTRRLLERRNGNALFTSYLDGLMKQQSPQINEELL